MAKTQLYESLARELETLLRDEPDFIANAANTAALLYHALPDVNWVGFYLLRDGDAELVVGPFQGRPACTRIAVGRGVCGTAAKLRKTIVVEDVHKFPGHIACDSASNSEIVVPMVLLEDDRLLGVLDIDSPRLGRFDAQDQTGLERLVEVFLAAR